MSLKLSAVVAVTPSYGIGMGGGLPWSEVGKLKKDLAYFKQITSATSNCEKQNAVIMGRITWESIPTSHRPLSGRINVVLTSNKDWALSLPSGVYSATSLDEAIALIESREELQSLVERAVVIGGSQLFEESIQHPNCTEYHVTEIDTDFECDTKLTPSTVSILRSLEPISISDSFSEKGLTYR